jgi:biopolymer transport protein ExbD
MAGVLKTEVKAEPNLTPILDMVFQLITFFMLVFNFKTAAMDLDLKLPVVGSARPVDPQNQEDLLVLSIGLDKDRSNLEKKEIYCLKFGGRPIPDVRVFIANEAQVSLLAARMTRDDILEGKELPTRVVIRADKRAPFKVVNEVIVACQEFGFRKFAFKTLEKEASKNASP